MKKSILKLEGVKELTKNEQKVVKGGAIPKCGYICFPGCSGCPK
ncbi:hypothetical protein [Flavobacterium sp.]|nr:hypothetical protein [Flavobacterium sp.]